MFKKCLKDHKFLRNLKSQAALEFLTTYAWAFLVILIMIGALAYFGVLNPSKILPDRCNFGTEVGCIDYQIGFGITGATDGTMNLRLKNNLGEPLIVDALTIESESAEDYICTVLPGVGFTWTSNEIIDLAFTGCNSAPVGFVKGDKGKVFVTIQYHLAKSSVTYTHEVAGEVVSTVI